MKKKSVRIILQGILLVIFSALIFFLGWVSFKVPAGMYGVLLSKSGGWYPSLIESGDFVWKWECLVPTNVKLFIFDLKPCVVTVHKTHELQSAKMYIALQEQPSDFRWDFSFTIGAQIQPEALLSLVKEQKIVEQKELDAYLEQLLRRSGEQAFFLFIKDYMTKTEKDREAIEIALTEYLQKLIETTAGACVKVQSLVMDKQVIPDLRLYTELAEQYDYYWAVKKNLLSEVLAKEASLSVAEQLQFERLERWADFLNRYPKLIEFLAVARDDAEKTLSVLNDVRKIKQPSKDFVEPAEDKKNEKEIETSKGNDS